MKENGGQKVHYLQKPVKLSLTTGERERERERERKKSSGMEIIYIFLLSREAFIAFHNTH